MSGLSSMCFCYIIWTILSAINQQRNIEDKGLATGVVTMIYLYNSCNVICAVIGRPYVMETCPYFMRVTGSMIYQLSSILSVCLTITLTQLPRRPSRGSITLSGAAILCSSWSLSISSSQKLGVMTWRTLLRCLDQVLLAAAERKQMMDGKKHFDNNMLLETAAAVEQTPTDALTEKA
ncbi:hypothetical protein V1512DRAFT_125937 [Lipomyces arxii]|uniref:uncharacterized protein n=1 Tax=Lipomyces arxii TaxID=56418 RepID=UPI0034CF07EB